MLSLVSLVKWLKHTEGLSVEIRLKGDQSDEKYL